MLEICAVFIGRGSTAEFGIVCKEIEVRMNFTGQVIYVGDEEHWAKNAALRDVALDFLPMRDSISQYDPLEPGDQEGPQPVKTFP